MHLVWSNKYIQDFYSTMDDSRLKYQQMNLTVRSFGLGPLLVKAIQNLLNWKHRHWQNGVHLLTKKKERICLILISENGFKLHFDLCYFEERDWSIWGRWSERPFSLHGVSDEQFDDVPVSPSMCRKLWHAPYNSNQPANTASLITNQQNTWLSEASSRRQRTFY